MKKNAKLLVMKYLDQFYSCVYFPNDVVGKRKISIAQTIISCEKLGIQFENCYRNEVMGSKNRSDSKGRSVLSMNDFYETKIRFDLR